jgi:hypothetical protein
MVGLGWGGSQPFSFSGGGDGDERICVLAQQGNAP